MEPLDFILSAQPTQEGEYYFSKGPVLTLIGSAYITFPLLNQSLWLGHEVLSLARPGSCAFLLKLRFWKWERSLLCRAGASTIWCDFLPQIYLDRFGLTLYLILRFAYFPVLTPYLHVGWPICEMLFLEVLSLICQHFYDFTSITSKCLLTEWSWS